MSKAKKSESILLLDLVWDNCERSSYARLNASMRKALTLAVGSGMSFDLNDVETIFGGYRSNYWLGASTEWIYSLAVAVGNRSAILSYEAARKRQPFIADDVDLENDSGFVHVTSVHRQRDRLCVGSRFRWRGRQVEVTSFAPGGDSLTACAHEFVDGARKVVKRFNVTGDGITAHRAERKERKKLFDRLCKLPDSERSKAVEALGAKTMKEADRLPIATVRRVAKRYLRREAGG